MYTFSGDMVPFTIFSLFDIIPLILNYVREAVGQVFTTYDEVIRFCEDNEVQMIDFKIIDLVGRWRHLSIPVKRFTPDTLVYGIGFDASNYGFAPVEHSDMVFIPDIKTSVYDPFTQVSTLSMIGDVFVIAQPENYRFNQDPRTIAARAESYMKETGIADEIRLGHEYEFYVFDHVSYELSPNKTGFFIDAEQAAWNSGDNSCPNSGYKIPVKSGYHIAPPQDVLYDLRARMCILMEENDIPIKYQHNEVGGTGQIEIEVEFGNLLEMADKTMLAKYLIKNLAFSEGKTVTFMPKPMFGEVGSGMHVHMHMFKNGQPLFYDKDGYSELSPLALNFIGGLLQHAPAVLALPTQHQTLTKDWSPAMKHRSISVLPPPIAVRLYEFPPMQKTLCTDALNFVLPMPPVTLTWLLLPFFWPVWTELKTGSTRWQQVMAPMI